MAGSLWRWTGVSFEIDRGMDRRYPTYHNPKYFDQLAFG